MHDPQDAILVNYWNGDSRSRATIELLFLELNTVISKAELTKLTHRPVSRITTNILPDIA